MAMVFLSKSACRRRHLLEYRLLFPPTESWDRARDVWEAASTSGSTRKPTDHDSYSDAAPGLAMGRNQ